MLKSRFSKVVCVLALLGIVAVSAHARVDMPEKAVTDDTVVVVWMDAALLSPEALREAAGSLNAALPPEMRSEQSQLQKKLEENLSKFRRGHEAFSEAGGKGILFLAEAPPTDGPPPDPAVLMRAPGANPREMETMLKSLNGDESLELVETGDGWLTEKNELDNVPTTGSAENAEAFQKILSNADPAPIRLAFRMNDKLKRQLDKQQGLQEQGGNPATVLINPLRSLDVGWATLNLGEKPALLTAMRFADDQAATQFSAGWQNLLMMAQGMVQMQLSGANPQNPPEQATVQGLFDQLRFDQEGSTLKATLGTEFIRRLGELAPSIQGFFLKMMGGGGQQAVPAPPQ